jgi:hypothetical protein
MVGRKYLEKNCKIKKIAKERKFGDKEMNPKNKIKLKLMIRKI